MVYTNIVAYIWVIMSPIEYKNTNKYTFLKEVEPLRIIINGKGPAVASLAKVGYGVYRNAMRGKISNPVILASILRAIREEVNRIQAQYAA